ncbi:MAG: hypothetical protein NZ959_03155 [Armatimonadetes bacterium]|nr:hypothetical protein [Armatimonadota bacterium]MDW8121551.1 hypothetical protein [Armatimonadota bacterium]
MVVEKVGYGGWTNCYRMSNGIIDLIVTADVGPRIIRLGFVGYENEFAEFSDQLGRTGGDQWRIYGGHRLWHAPEAKPRTYSPDNQPVEIIVSDSHLTAVQKTEQETGIQKSLVIKIHPIRPQVTVSHILTNRNLWAVELAPWALSVMAPGGRALIPLPPYIPHEEKLLPAAPLVLWHYTDLSDARWQFGRRLIVLRQDPQQSQPQKIGLSNGEGWLAYHRSDRLFVKRYQHFWDRAYPDFGASTEVFTNAEMLELETLGPLTRLEPDQSVTHTEHWSLYKGVALPDEPDQIAEALDALFEAER